jgi:hypothetical protein
MWSELKSNGVPLLILAIVLAAVNALLFAVSGPIDAFLFEEFQVVCEKVPGGRCFYVRPMAVLVAAASLMTVLGIGNFNAFGVRSKRRLSYFEATQPYDTAQFAGLKIVIRSACMLIALMIIGMTIWTSLPLLGDAVFIQMWNVRLVGQQSVVSATVAALAGYKQFALILVVVIGIVLWVAVLAALGALWSRYSRRTNVAASLLLLSGLALALMPLAERNGMLPAGSIDALFTGIRWSGTLAVILAIAYLSWRGFAERILTLRYALGVLAVLTAFVAASLTLQFGTNTSSVLWLIPPLMISVLAPWSLNRARHL